MTRATESPAPERRALDRALMRGVAWTTGGRWLYQGLSWVVSLAIARLLSPTDYGIVGMAWVYVGLVQLAGELGIGAALIQCRDIDGSVVSRLYGLAVTLGAIFAVASWPAGMAMGVFYREPAIAAVVAVYGLNFVASGLRSVPHTLLTRDFAFRQLAGVTVLEGLIASLTSLVFAWLGLGYWALVIGYTVGVWIATLLLCWVRPVRLAAPFLTAEERHLLAFGAKVTLSRLGWYAYSNADFVVVGRLLGSAQLGFYTLAWQLASIPLERLAGSVTQVLFPVLSAVRDDNKALARYFTGLVEVLTLVLLPLTVGMALVSTRFFSGVLGSKWVPAALPFALLALSSTSRLLSSLAQQVLLARGEARFTAMITLSAAIIMPLAFYFAASHGISWVAAVWLVLHPLVLLLPALAKVWSLTTISPVSLGLTMLPATLATAAMAGTVLLVSPHLQQENPLLALGSLVAIGGLTYAGALVAFHRGRLLQLARTLRQMRGGAAA